MLSNHKLQLCSITILLALVLNYLFNKFIILVLAEELARKLEEVEDELRTAKRKHAAIVKVRYHITNVIFITSCYCQGEGTILLISCL